MNCIFCRIIEREAPASIVYEDDETIAFMDIYPVARGHTLVVPKTHAAGLFDISPEVCARTMLTAAKVSKAIRYALKPDGMNLWQSTGRAANQDVFHFHVHLIPRWYGDGLTAPHGRARSARDTLDDIAVQIREAMNSRK
jgi:histidine triad (HIT) family protein